MVGMKINKTLRNVLIAVAIIVVIFALTSLLPDKGFSEKYEGFDLSTSSGAVSTTKTYKDYLAGYKNAKNAKSTVKIDIFDFDEAKTTDDVHIERNYRGKDAVFTDENSSVTWNFDVEESGFYIFLWNILVILQEILIWKESFISMVKFLSLAQIFCLFIVYGKMANHTMKTEISLKSKLIIRETRFVLHRLNFLNIRMSI